MTTTPTPPVVPPDDSEGRDAADGTTPDSAEADRVASTQGTGAVDDLSVDPEPDGAEADYAASMGEDPHTE